MTETVPVGTQKCPALLSERMGVWQIVDELKLDCIYLFKSLAKYSQRGVGIRQEFI